MVWRANIAIGTRTGNAFSCNWYWGAPKASCSWSGWKNKYDGELNYVCPNNGFIAGVESVHSNWYEDRIWNLKCCTNKSYRHRNCKWTGWVNGWDGNMAFWEPKKTKKLIAGWNSVHSNWYEDRRHRFLICNY